MYTASYFLPGKLEGRSVQFPINTGCTTNLLFKGVWLVAGSVTELYGEQWRQWSEGGLYPGSFLRCPKVSLSPARSSNGGRCSTGWHRWGCHPRNALAGETQLFSRIQPTDIQHDWLARTVAVSKGNVQRTHEPSVSPNSKRTQTPYPV